MIQPPSTHINYHINDASCFWSIRDDSINVYDPSNEDMVTITGVDADDAFRMCRNLMCNMQPVFNELKTDEHTVKNAIEMRTALDNYIKANQSLPVPPKV